MIPEPERAVEIPSSRGLIRDGIWVVLLTFASKLLGLVREGILAWAFGTSALVDALRVAQTGILLVIHLIAGSMLDSAFLPTFKRLHSRGRIRVAWRVVRIATRALALLGGVLFLALILGRDLWTSLLAPGFDAARLRFTALLIATMAIAVPLMLEANLLATLSAALYRFRLPAFRALIQNVAVLAGTAIAVVLGARLHPERAILPLGLALPAAQFAILILLRRSLRDVDQCSPRGTPARDRRLWKLLGIAIAPGFALVLMEQLTVIVERVVASRLAEGAIASLDYARFLVETPLVTVGVGITQTLLPTLSDLSATGDRARFVSSIRTLLLGCLWALLPLTVWLLCFGEELVRVVYARGAFSDDSVRTTTAALSGFAVGLWAWFGGTILQRAYYAEHRLRTLVPLTALNLITFAVLSFLWAPTLGVRGVSTAFSVANALFFFGSLLFLGWELARGILPTLLYLLIGGGLAYLLLPRIVPEASSVVRLLSGGSLTLVAWLIWTAINPMTRNLALGLIKVSRRAR